MMAQMSGGAPMRNWFTRKRLIMVAAIVVIIFASAFMLYFYLSFVSVLKGQNHYAVNLPVPHISAAVVSQDVLYYNGSGLVPYVLIGYTSSNVTSITANVSLFKYPPPRHIFMLNISNECFNCGNTDAIGSALAVDLERYGLILGPGNLSVISPANVRALPPNSILIILNGLLPSSLLSANSTSGLSYLLNEHTSIIYVGQNFSRMLLPDSIVTPTPAYMMPSYLSTVSTTGMRPGKGPNAISSFYFNNGTFGFVNGANYGTASYTNIYNGSIFAFSDTPNSWPVNQSAADIAKAVRGLFWLPRYAYGTTTITLPTSANYGSRVGVVLDGEHAQADNSFVVAASQYGSIMATISANATYPSGTSSSTHQYLFTRPMLYQNGTIKIQNHTITNQSIPIRFTVYTGSTTPTNITPSVTIYTTNLSVVDELPFPYIHKRRATSHS